MKKGWEVKRMGEVCEVQNGYAFSSKNYSDSGHYLMRIGNVQNGYISLANSKFVKLPTDGSLQRFVLAKGDILVSLTGNVGRVGVIHDEHLPAVLNQRVARITIRKHALSIRGYLLFFLFSDLFREELAGTGHGAAQQNVSTKNIVEIPIPIPPLAEQRRLVALLDEAFAGIAQAKANTEKNLQNARALFESELNAVFSQRGEGWVEKALGGIGKVSMCKRIFKEETTATGDIPFYKIGTFGREPDAFIPIHRYNEYRAKYSFPRKGDVLISASGTIGRRVRYDGEPAYFQDSNIVWIENDERQVLNDYLYHFYGACDWNSTKGATISRLYNDNLRRIVIAFPESRQEQRRIVTHLDTLSAETRRLAAVYERKLGELEALKKSLLHQAFAGAL